MRLSREYAAYEWDPLLGGSSIATSDVAPALTAERRDNRSSRPIVPVGTVVTPRRHVRLPGAPQHVVRGPGAGGACPSERSPTPDAAVVGLITERSDVHASPPPPLVADFGRLLHTLKLLTSSFRSAVCRLWGPFVGTYSTFGLCGVGRAPGHRRADTPAASRLGVGAEGALRRARRVQRHEPALLNDLPRCTRYMSVKCGVRGTGSSPSARS